MGLDEARQHLLDALRGEIRDPRVMDAMARVPRELFVPPDLETSAYNDGPLPVGYGQTISQPLIVAIMTEALVLRSSDKVLELGTGSGYQTAILSLLSSEIVSVERILPLQEKAARVLTQFGAANVSLVTAGPELGYAPKAPYDAILVTAAAPHVPPALLDQLKDGGRLVIPVGGRGEQDLLRIIKHGNTLTTESLGGCRFVPLIGPGAWPVDPDLTMT
jgi:protein-L-isoaspartate(D-aspartate) O-methyltransferase